MIRLVVASSLFLALAITARDPGGERARGPLPQQVYVWQRIWTGEVAGAVRDADACSAGLVVQGARVGWARGAAEVQRVSLDLAALRACGRPVGVAMRIDPTAGPFASGDARTAAVVSAARQLVEDGARGGIRWAELQVDFDCAERHLAGYAAWVRAVRAAVAPVPVRLTALPSWLDSARWPELARAGDGFVLQVHAAHRPASDAARPELCNPQQARAWVERAAWAGVPFRVALPTYTYLVGVDAGGKVVRVEADGLARPWPAGTRVLRYDARADELGMLVDGWRRDRPGLLGGVIWYRLPVGAERNNWRWPTLRALLAGQVPRPKLRVSAEEQPAGKGGATVDLVLENAGDADAELPAAVAVGAGAVDAADAVGGFSLGTGPRPGSCLFVNSKDVGVGPLRAGDRRCIGWVRGQGPFTVRIEERIDGR